MDERDLALRFAARLLDVADALDPDGPKHLVMTTADLRALLETSQLPSKKIDEVMHHAFHEHGAGKIAFLADSWRPAPRCPECGGRAVPIVYGMPPAALGNLAELGVIELGGCIVEPDQPDFRCARCGESWA